MMPIRLDTLAGLHTHDFGLSLFCPFCRRWHDLDLATAVKFGRGYVDVTAFRPICRVCETRGEKQVRPPLPRFEGYPA